jgi:hypothetical protein
VILALLNFFGQRPTASSATAQGASLEMSTPSRLRGGLIFQSRFRFSADHTLRHPVLELSDDWFESMTLNSIQPQPVDEERGDNGIRLLFGKLAEGKTASVYLEWSVNPTNVSSRTETATLLDGDQPLTSVDRHVVIFP